MSEAAGVEKLQAELAGSRRAHEVTAQERDRFVVELGYIGRWSKAAELILAQVRAIQTVAREGAADQVASLEKDLRLTQVPGPPPTPCTTALSAPSVPELRRILELATQRDEFRTRDAAIVQRFERWLDLLENR